MLGLYRCQHAPIKWVEWKAPNGSGCGFRRPSGISGRWPAGSISLCKSPCIREHCQLRESWQARTAPSLRLEKLRRRTRASLAGGLLGLVALGKGMLSTRKTLGKKTREKLERQGYGLLPAKISFKAH